MSTQDNRSDQQAGVGSQPNTLQGSQPQHGASNQPGSQAQQFSSTGSQQGGTAGQYGGPAAQQGGSQQTQYSPERSQQAYSPERSQQGQPGQGALSRQRAGMPSLFGRTSPFDMLRRLDEDMDRLFHQFWGGGRNLMRGRGSDAPSMWMPQVEMCERGGKLHVFADLPGMRKEDVKITLEGDQLVLQGERRSSHEEGQQGSGFYQTERSYGSFYRCIPLPDGTDPQTVDASFKDGVLDVCFDAPRVAQQQSRQIEIRDGGATTPGSGSYGSGGRSSGQS